MANKQVTVFVVDLGSSMAEATGGRSESDLEFAESFIWDKITSTVANGRKTDTIGVIGFRTNGSDNSLLKMGEEYEHITILSPIGQFLMPQIRSLQQTLVPNKTNVGDGVSAVVVAIDMIEKYCKKLKYIRNIIMVTNGTGAFDTDGLDDIVAKIAENNIKVTILGVDFDDVEYGFKEEDKDQKKLANELALRELCEKCEGQFGTLAEAVEALENPRPKKISPVPSFKGPLQLGKPDSGSGTFSIDVERYPRTMVAKPVSASTFVNSNTQVDGTGGGSSSSAASGSDLQKVRNARTYQVEAEDAPGGKMDIDKEKMAKGYMYGSTIVPISESDQDVVKFESEAGLQIIGFVSRGPFERFLCMSNASVIIGSKVNNKAILALSSFVHALHELEILAVARLVARTDKAPVIIILAPSIEPDYECLVDVQLPFADDVRQYKFAPLDNVKTISGKTLTKHRFIPAEELQEAVDDYVDAMDLLTQSTDTNEDGTPSDVITPEDAFSPLLHRIDQVIRWRVTHNNSGSLPSIYACLTKYVASPSSLIEDAKEDIERLAKVSDLRKMPPRAKGSKRHREEQKPLSGLDVDKLLEPRAKKQRIDPQNAIPEFKQRAENLADIHSGEYADLVKQMAKIIKGNILNSMADSAYGIAIESMKVVRRMCVETESANVYNMFARDLKQCLQNGSLGGNRKDFITRIRKEKVGLITSDEDRDSDVSPEDGRKFYFEKS